MKRALGYVSVCFVIAGVGCLSDRDVPGANNESGGVTTLAGPGSGGGEGGDGGMTATSGSASTTTASTATGAGGAGGAGGSTSTTGTAGAGAPLYGYCGCIADGLETQGLCRSCWNGATAPGGSCEEIWLGCGTNCQNAFNSLPTQCTGGVVDQACLDAVAGTAGLQLDDLATLLGCFCSSCSDCDEAACP